MAQSKQEIQERTPTVWRAGAYSWELKSRALVMSILNATPDSFSDGGRFSSLQQILEVAKKAVSDGAEILDVGGESTRPGAAEISPTEECSRVLPVVRELSQLEIAAISIDTCKASVASKALAAGAHIVNDVSGFRDPDMIKVCADSDCGIVVMHMQGSPRTMQKDPVYSDVLDEVRDFFEERYQTLTAAGIVPERIVFDPGIGFGKTLTHNLSLLKCLEQLRVRNRPILIGLSRKSLIASLTGLSKPAERDNATQALSAYARLQGALIHRVHEIKGNTESIRMIEAIHSGE